MKKLINLVLLALIISVSSCVERIDVGNVGLKVNLAGSEKGVASTDYVNGYQFYIPFVTDIVEYNAKIQTVEYQDYSVGVKGGLAFIAHPKLTYKINRGKAHLTYNSFGTDNLEIIQNGYMHTAVTKALGDVANKYSPDSLLISREEYEFETQKHIERLCDTLGIDIISFRANLSPPEALAEAITNKQKVAQENQQLEQQKLSIQIAGEKKVIEAKLAAEAQIAAANGNYQSSKLNAQADRERQAAWTDNYVKVKYLETWDGALPQYILGSNTSMFMQMPK